MPIKILHVIAGMGSGGAEAMIMNWYRNIDRDSVQFDFLLRSTENIYSEEISKLGGKVYYTAEYPRHFLKNRKETIQFFKQHAIEYAAIHVHCNALLYVNIFNIAKKYGIETRIIHSHSTKTKNKLFELLHKFNKVRIHKKATHFFACSHEAAKWSFNSKCKYQIITNGIDVDRFKYSDVVREKFRSELNLDGKIVIGHVGRFLDVKNHMYLLDVFEKINQLRQNSMLVLVGTGPLEKMIQAEAKQRGLSEKIVFLGVRKDVENIYSAMDVFAFPSKYEGFGLALVEAQANGLPCVASDCIPKDCKALDSLKFLPIDDAETWADYILNMPTVNNRIMCCVDVAKAGFDIKRVVEKLQEFYSSI